MNGNVGVYFILICVISAEFTYRSSRSPQGALGYSLRRYRRQSAQCKTGEIACGSGACILEENECDGKADCDDESDEANCASFRCTSNLFQCAYGACIKRSAICDGKKDCKDNSDETTPLCKSRVTTKAPICGNGEFQCDSTDCINEELLCDGKADCPDSSDESVKECSAIPCNKGIFFRCNYGACLSKTVKCNGVKDCFDGSDERNCPTTSTIKIPTPTPPSTKKPTPTPTTKPKEPTVPPPSGSCLIPNHPDNGEYKVGANKATPGEYTPLFSALIVHCKSRFKPNPPIVKGAFPLCLNGKWSTKPPSCALSCKSLSSTSTTKVKCIHLGQELDNCDNPVHGTVASVECESFHEIPDISQNPDTVCKDGSWDYASVQCLPVCGEKRPKGTANIIGGKVALKSDYPWHIGIYNSTNDNICGGSLISQQVVLSAAHCFTNQYGKLHPIENYKVMAGKYYRAYDDSRDEGAQDSSIDNIFLPERYKGSENFHEADIAVIVLSKRLKSSLDVQPICVDWRNLYEQGQLTENNVGVVVGWGQTVLGSEPSPELKELQVPFKPYSDCYEQVPPEFRKFLTHDKICAGYLSQKQSVCQGDSGGGLAFQRNNNRFYIRGIVSTSPSSKETGTITCDADQYATYTLVSKYLGLISSIEILYRS